mmetsp:Transcript_131293/g.245689  ORF Transcript_131293/g.245689 Transcript_131293/m.245689 type:complete len:82 (-) Transcript_131293:169-414(-)
MCEAAKTLDIRTEQCPAKLQSLTSLSNWSHLDSLQKFSTLGAIDQLVALDPCLEHVRAGTACDVMIGHPLTMHANVRSWID